MVLLLGFMKEATCILHSCSLFLGLGDWDYVVFAWLGSITKEEEEEDEDERRASFWTASKRRLLLFLKHFDFFSSFYYIFFFSNIRTP